MKTDIARGWGLLWRSYNALDGPTERLMWDGVYRPTLFRTRGEARDYIQNTWGYIHKRPDLRREPHGWKMPRAVRVRIKLEIEP